MNILIVGNGFDLAHGLKTDYESFLKWCKKNDYKKINRGTRTNVSENIWVEHFLFRINNKISENLGQNWTDFEEKIYEIIKEISCNYNKDFKKGCIAYKDDKKKYHLNKCLLKFESLYDNKYTEFDDIKNLIAFLYNALIDLTHLFEEYLKEIDYDNCQKIFDLSDIVDNARYGNFCVLSFNYTKTLQKLYNINDKNIYYIHGEIGKDNIVLAAKDFNNNENKNEEKTPDIFNIFQKHNQRHKYETIKAYQELLRRIKFGQDPNGENNFYIIGHSLDNADKDILQILLGILTDSRINIYRRSNSSVDKYVNKITDIIGKKQVMERVLIVNQEETITIKIEEKTPALSHSK
jgi:IS1 family transposase